MLGLREPTGRAGVPRGLRAPCPLPHSGSPWKLQGHSSPLTGEKAGVSALTAPPSWNPGSARSYQNRAEVSPDAAWKAKEVPGILLEGPGCDSPRHVNSPCLHPHKSCWAAENSLTCLARVNALGLADAGSKPWQSQAPASCPLPPSSQTSTATRPAQAQGHVCARMCVRVCEPCPCAGVAEGVRGQVGSERPAPCA